MSGTGFPSAEDAMSMTEFLVIVFILGPAIAVFWWLLCERLPDIW